MEKEKRVKRTRNAATWTEADYFSAIRSALRGKFKWWKPGIIALNKAVVLKPTAGGKVKKMYKCACCEQLFIRKNVEIDHIEEVGSLRSLDDIVGFIQRLTPESPDKFQILCKPCHGIKTNAARLKRKREK